ncbi:Tyrosine-Protein Kinase Yes [Manis pentadactyla]|nr:Tyrosine-Protein Kinase Yes [Manis pentadactyla]
MQLLCFPLYTAKHNIKPQCSGTAPCQEWPCQNIRQQMKDGEGPAHWRLLALPLLTSGPMGHLAGSCPSPADTKDP